MKRIIPIIFILLVAFSALALAVETSSYITFDETALEGLSDAEKIEAQKQMIIAQLDTIKENFNTQVEIPKAFQRFLTDLNANFYLDNGYIIGMEMQDSKIVTLQTGEISEPDMKVYVKDAIFDDLNKNNFNIKSSLGKGDIEIQGVGFMNKIKFGTLKVLLRTLG